MKVLVSNRKALYDFAISEEMVAGLVLSGAEVKSLKSGQGSLKGAYVSIRPTARKTGNGAEAYLVKAHITPYKYAAGAKNPIEPERERKLLLKKSELKSLIGKEKGGVVVPIEIFQGRRGLVKIKIAVGRSKKKYDKRETIKKREIERKIRRGED